MIASLSPDRDINDICFDRHIGRHLDISNFFVVKFGFYEFIDTQNIGFDTLFPMIAPLSPEISMKSVLAAILAAILKTVILLLLNLVSTNFYSLTPKT